MYRNPDGNGRRGSGWYGGFGYEPMPRNTGNSGGCYTGGQNGYTCLLYTSPSPRDA